MSGPFLSEVLRRAAAEHADGDAFVAANGATISYAALDKCASEAAAGLAAHDIGEGAVVALAMPSTIDYVIAYLGAVRVGAVVAGLNPAFTTPEVAACISAVDPDLIVRSSAFDAATDASYPTLETTPGHDVGTWARELRGIELVPDVASDSDRPVCICFTSGSTGLPKAAYFTDRQLESIAELDTGGAWGSGGHGLSSTQFAHVGFMTKLPWMMATGRTTHLLDKWSAGPVLELIARHQMPAVTGVAPQIALMLRHPDFDQHDFSAVRVIVVGAAASPPDLVDEARRRFGAPYSIRYSSTESGGIGLGTALDADDEEALHTVGRPRPGVEIQIRDSDGEALPHGETGRLWLRSPAVMAGYWNNPAGTSAALRDGWLDTGDLARLDDAGCVRLSGRAKEMFIRGGYNIFPLEVEAALVAHPQIVELAIVPRPDPVMGEVGIAVVVSANPADPVSLESLRAFGAELLAHHKLPEAIQSIDALPRNASDKVDRRALTRLVSPIEDD